MTNKISFSISYKKFREPKKIEIAAGFHIVYGESGVGYTPTLVVSYGGLWGENYWYSKKDIRPRLLYMKNGYLAGMYHNIIPQKGL